MVVKAVVGGRRQYCARRTVALRPVKLGMLFVDMWAVLCSINA
jgi:hypothetical protein